MSSQFYVTLPSNSSMETFPQNTLAAFTTKLAHAVTLTGEWEVGLSEVQFPISWYNIDGDEGVFVLKQHVNDVQAITTRMKKGYYADPDEVVFQFNKAFNSKLKGENRERVQLSFDNISQKMTISLKPHSMLYLTKSFAGLLGFYEEDFDESDRVLKTDGVNASNTIAIGPWDTDKKIESRRVCDLQRGFYCLFVYCDLIEPVLVGDVKAPILRIVNIKGKEGEMINRIYQNVQYAPLQKKMFETIEINIRDDTGRLVPFERGRVIVTLHFRQKKPSFYRP